MHNLISWTGWTKEDWQHALKCAGEFLAFGGLMGLMFFIPGLFG